METLVPSLTVILLGVLIVSSSPVKGLGRFFAPDSMAAIMLTLIFGFRPLIVDRFDYVSFYGYVPSAEGLATASAVGLALMLSILVGASIATASKKRALAGGRRSVTIETVIDRSPSSVVTGTVSGLPEVAIACLFALAYLGVLIQFSGADIIAQLAGGRAKDVAIGGLPVFVLIIPLAGSISASALILRLRNRRIRFGNVLAVLFCVSLSLILVSQLGNRRFIIPALLIPVVAAIAGRTVKVRIWHIAGGVVALAFLAVIPFVRSAGARLPGESLVEASLRVLSDDGLISLLRPILASYDTEMYDYVALVSQHIGGDIPWGLGRGTIMEFLLGPVPQSLTPVVPFSDQILTALWGGGCGELFCPVPSVAGVLYFDGGLIAVIVGGLLLGVTLRLLSYSWEWVSVDRPFASTALIVASSFVLVAMRTNTIHAIWWMIYSMILGFATVWMLGLLRGKSGHAKEKRLLSELTPHERGTDRKTLNSDEPAA